MIGTSKSILRLISALHQNLQAPSCSFLRRRSGLDLKQTSSDRDGHRMRPIIGSQLVHQVLDMEVDGGFRNRQLIGDLLVAIPVTNESEHFQFPTRKIVVP